MRAILILTCVLFLTPSVSLADVFRADFRTIAHAEAKSDSAAVIYIDVGEYADILPDKEQFGWIRIRYNNTNGWVLKRNGAIVKGELPGKMQFWFGNLHAHTSEGSQERNVAQSSHEEALNYASSDTDGNLDFLALTPHNYLVSQEAYSRLQDKVNHKKYYQKGKFVPIAGQEFGSADSGNRINVYELYRLIPPDNTQSGDNSSSTVRNSDFKELFESFIPKYQTEFTFAQFNLPQSADFSGIRGIEFGRDDYQSDIQRWVAANSPVVQHIEVIKPPMYNDAADFPHYDESEIAINAWLWALSQGWHLAPAANQANHQFNWGNASDSRTVAVAPELSRQALLTAFQQRRCYASEDSSLQVTFKAGGLWMGDQVREGDFNGLFLSAFDPQEPDAVYRFDVHRGRIQGEPLTIESSPFISKRGILSGDSIVLDEFEVRAGEFYLVHVRQSNTPEDPNQNVEGDDAWTAPIWIVSDSH